jgi:betaine-aldehyde dehydrogenase
VGNATRGKIEGSEKVVSELHINGTWVGATGGAVREIQCPADQTLVATVAEAAPADALRAIAAARAAFDGNWWKSTSVIERGQILERTAA